MGSNQIKLQQNYNTKNCVRVYSCDCDRIDDKYELYKTSRQTD